MWSFDHHDQVAELAWPPGEPGIGAPCLHGEGGSLLRDSLIDAGLVPSAGCQFRGWWAPDIKGRRPENRRAALVLAALLPFFANGCQDLFDRVTQARQEASAPEERTCASGSDVTRDQMQEMAASEAERQQLDPAFVSAVIQIESGWYPHAVSSRGALGLMQLLPATARGYGVTDPAGLFDPQTNLRVGSTHLRELLERFCGDARLALWAWHAGVERVDADAPAITPVASAEFVRQVLARYGEARGPALLATVARSDCRGRRTSGLEAEVAFAELAPNPLGPVAAISHAWLSSLTARVGEPVVLRIEVGNQGGPARRGVILVQLLQHPRVRIGMESDLAVQPYRRGTLYAPPWGRPVRLASTVIEGSSDAWLAGEEHALVVQIIPEEPGEVILSYSVILEGERGLNVYPAVSAPEDALSRPPKVVKVLVTPTLAWRQP